MTVNVVSTVLTHGWIDEVVHTPDIKLRSHRITLTYNKLGQQWDELTYCDFATWGTHTVGRVIRGDRDLKGWRRRVLEPVQNVVAGHLAKAQLTMFDNVAHDVVDRKRKGWSITDIDILATVFEEQKRVTKGVSDAVNVLADYWGIDRDRWAKYFTKFMPAAELPNESLRFCRRVKGTRGAIGAPVTDYRSFEQRCLWIEGVLETHMTDLSLKSSVYTLEQERAIVEGTWT